MKTMRTMKGGAGVLALALAASFLFLLPGCQAPAGPQADPTGTVSLTIGHVGRAIQPNIAIGDFTGFTAVFARENHDSVIVNFPQGETTAQAELPQGVWNLTVNALIGSVVAATYSRLEQLNVGPGFTPVTAVLSPIFTGGFGTFSWALTVPTGTTGELTVWSVDEYGVMVGTIDIAGYDTAFAGDPNPLLWEGSLQLAAGAYFVRFALEHDDYGVAALNSDLHVYQGMTSRVERTFTDDQFHDAVADENIYSAAVSIAVPVTGETPATTATVAGSAGFTAGPVTWQPADSPFRPETAYTATVTLTANPGHVFASGVTATVNGQPATVTGAGATVTLEHTFGATGPEPVLAAWNFSGSAAVDGARDPGNTAVQPSGGQQQNARLQFLTLSGSELTSRELNGTINGVNVVNPAGTGSGLNGLANNAWWQTVISTAGRTDIAVEWRMRSTAAAPRDWRLQYRTGSAGEWRNVGGVIAVPLNDDGSNPSIGDQPFKRRFLPLTAEGQERLYLRWLMTSNVSASGGTVGVGGTHQINNLVIRADSAPFGNDYDCDHCSDDGCPECEPSVDVIRISAANLIEPATVAAAQVVTVEGFVTNRTMIANGTALDNFNIFLQDGTSPRDGILVWGGTGAGNRNLVAYTGQWVRVTGYVTRAGGATGPRNQIQVGSSGTAAGDITIIAPPANAPTFDPQPVQLADIVAPNNDYWFMPISLERVRFGRNDNQADFLAPGANTDAAPGRSHFVIVENGQRLELRPPVGASDYLPLGGFATNDYINITRAYVSWNNARGGVMQLLHAVVVPAP